MTEARHWVEEKRWLIGIFASILTVAISGAMWVGDVSARMSKAETAIERMSDQVERIVKVETKVESIERILGRVEDKLDTALGKR